MSTLPYHAMMFSSKFGKIKSDSEFDSNRSFPQNLPTRTGPLRALLVNASILEHDGFPQFGQLKMSVTYCVIIFNSLCWGLRMLGVDMSSSRGFTPAAGADQFSCLIGLLLSLLPLVGFAWCRYYFHTKKSHLDALSQSICWNTNNIGTFRDYSSTITRQVYFGSIFGSLFTTFWLRFANDQYSFTFSFDVEDFFLILFHFFLVWVSTFTFFACGGVIVTIFHLHVLQFRTIFFYISKELWDVKKIINRYSSSKQQLLISASVLSSLLTFIAAIAFFSCLLFIVGLVYMGNGLTFKLFGCSLTKLFVVLFILSRASCVASEMSDIFTLINHVVQKASDNSDLSLLETTHVFSIHEDEELNDKKTESQSTTNTISEICEQKNPLNFEEALKLHSYFAAALSDGVQGFPIFGFSVTKVILGRVAYVMLLVLVSAAQKSLGSK